MESTVIVNTFNLQVYKCFTEFSPDVTEYDSGNMLILPSCVSNPWSEAEFAFGQSEVELEQILAWAQRPEYNFSLTLRQSNAVGAQFFKSSIF